MPHASTIASHAAACVLLAWIGSAPAQEPFVPPPLLNGQPVPWADPLLPAVPPPGVFPDHPVPPGLLPPPGAVLPDPGFRGFERPLLLEDYDWLYIDAPQPREIAVNDIITIIVKEQSRMAVDSRYNRNRTATIKAELKEFLRLDDDGRLANAAANQPTIDGNLTSRLQSTGQVAEREELIYRIAATVMDVKPNGNLELSARKSIVANGDLLEYELSGTLRAQDVNRDNTALSENVADLQIVKRQKGKLSDSTKRPWGWRLYDLIFPF
ncbi:MAG TPA: flagellar basal body L-ring protein FlgH [Planctomycetaceae bacterium]|nr:flagellar basal body L-ring protein FlgH [Planctomycetaceae bacterium]